MNYQEILKFNRIEEFEILSESKYVCLFTNKEAKPRKECNWFYRVMVSDEGESLDLYLVDEGGGSLLHCECSECSDFGNDRFELYSMFQALCWAKTHAPNCEIELWISADKIFSLWNEDEIWTLSYSNCQFLKSLGTEIYKFIYELNIRAEKYCYANKEVIPHFFLSSDN
jgi:hypothetical protein